MIIDKTFTFYCIFHKKLHHIQDFDVQYDLPKWKRYPFTPSSFRFHENLSLPHPWSQLLLYESLHNNRDIFYDDKVLI